jgi:hypothetical protein
MPEIIKTYEVQQTREVEVVAHNEVDALAIATAAFNNGQNSDDGVVDGPINVWGNTTKKIKLIDATVREELF